MTTENEGPDHLAAPDFAPEPVEAPEVTTEGAEAEAGEDTPEPDEEAPKPKKSAQERISEITAARREAEREAEYWKSKALQPQQTNPAPQAAPEEDKEPDPADYEHGELDARFIREHATFSANKAFEARLSQWQQEQSAQAQNAAWQAKEAAIHEKYPDYQEKVVAGANNWPCTPNMANAIRNSEVGPEIAYHLATNPADARRIASLSPDSQGLELGIIAAELKRAPAVQAKVVTTAPEPGPALKGQVGVTTNRPDDRQSMDDWIAARNRQLGR